MPRPPRSPRHLAANHFLAYCGTFQFLDETWFAPSSRGSKRGANGSSQYPFSIALLQMPYCDHSFGDMTLPPAAEAAFEKSETRLLRLEHSWSWSSRSRRRCRSVCFSALSYSCPNSTLLRRDSVRRRVGMHLSASPCPLSQ
ncbi:hypothetical protein CFRS1_v008570 [Colletotrichum fructicola]|nr:hypothetical protein CFRS1_v008570 [Colletotrichum fructicola]